MKALRFRTVFAGALALASLPACASSPPNDDGCEPTAARTELSTALGARTSAPSAALTQRLDLSVSVRAQGRVVDELLDRGAAARAGLRVGDVILQADEVALFSQDDLDDVLRTKRTGAEIRLKVKRRDSRLDEELSATLAAGDIPSSPLALAWHFASLAQLPQALDVARAQKKRVLVGLSGAET